MEKPIHVRLHTRRLKGGAFALEAINSIATTYFFYYVYFLAQKKFGFDTLHNFLLAAVLGFSYVGAAVYGGRYAQRKGYFKAVRVGAALMAICFAVGAFVDAWWPTFALVMVANFGLSYTWPALEAMVSEGEPRHRMQSMVGIYNFTWAGAGAFAYFTGGAMIERFGLRSMYLVPAGLLGVEYVVAAFLEREIRELGGGEQKWKMEDGKWKTADSTQDVTREVPNNSREVPDDLREVPAGIMACVGTASSPRPSPPEEEREKEADEGGIGEKHEHAPAFLKMAWVANPFAYLGCNTVVAIIPTLAHKLNLTPMMAGFSCSVWLFVRAASFVWLRFWPKWHYKFGLLVAAYVAMIAAFIVILVIPNLWALIGAQVVFGLAHGLIYYSSLFYSMDVGETKGEHSGIHEAAIGAGNGGGPAIAALAIWVWPAYPASGAWAVTILLLVGLGIIFYLKPPVLAPRRT